MKKTIVALIAFFIASVLYANTVDPLVFYVQQGKRIFEIGKYKDAIIHFDNAIEINKDSAEALLWKGNSLMMLDKKDEAMREYRRAQRIDPSLKIPPNLDPYYKREEMRERDASDIRSRYWDRRAGKYVRTEPAAEEPVETAKTAEKKEPEKQDDTPEPEATPTPVKEEKKEVRTPLRQEAKDKIITARELSREQWSKGGRAKMTSLGGLKLTIPDQTTALDGAARGIKSGFLFRKEEHFISFQPFWGKYGKVLKYFDEKEFFNETQILTLSDSVGDVSWPTEKFMNSVQAYYHNTYNKYTVYSIPLPDGPDVINNKTGNLFGGTYIAGYKPIPLLGAAASLGYLYAPYRQAVFNDGLMDVDNDILVTELSWDISVGMFLPYIITPQDKLDITASFGTYNPEKSYGDITFKSWFDMPYQLSRTSFIKVTDRETYEYGTENDPDVDAVVEAASNVNTEDLWLEQTYEYDTAGFNIKGNVHYMIGNGEHEAFCFIEAPVHVLTDANFKNEIYTRILGVPTALETLESGMKTVGKFKAFRVKSGARTNFQYVTAALGYDYEFSETNIHYDDVTFTAQYDPIPGNYTGLAGLVKTHTHSFLLGASVTPIKYISIPIEYEWTGTNAETEADYIDRNVYEIRFGLDIKPSHRFSVRGGLSYQFTRFDGTGIAGTDPVTGISYPDGISSGQHGNPFLNKMGYHAGIGFNMPEFEFNLGTAYNILYASPEYLNLKDGYSYYLQGYLDFNLYL
ncbi:MAG: tetratricopeptide repeat protein [Candidatus Goldiibacteriota bacterium]